MSSTLFTFMLSMLMVSCGQLGAPEAIGERTDASSIDYDDVPAYRSYVMKVNPVIKTGSSNLAANLDYESLVDENPTFITNNASTGSRFAYSGGIQTFL